MDEPQLPPGAARWFRVARGVLRGMALLAPAHRRADWQREWEAEIWHALADGRHIQWRLVGALPHALWLRRAEWSADLIGQDLKFAWRSTRKRPAFSTLVIGTLALGIGACTAMFTIVNTVLIQPLPYPHAEQLVYLNGSFAKYDGAAISPPDFLDYRAGNTVFSSLAARAAGGTAAITSTGDPERVTSSDITANYFATLGVKPLLGRTFRDEEETGNHAVAILAYALWQRRFGGDPHIVGATAVIDGAATQIVGVMPPLLDRTLPDAELWRPLVFHAQWTSIRRFHFLHAIGRLRPGVALPQARAAMDLVAHGLAATYPENATWHLRLRPYRDVVVGDVGRSLVMLLVAVGLVLLIACGNVASLLLARATTRRGEISVRTALGASRTRLIRQLLTEALVYAVAGGALGLATAHAMIAGVRVIAGGFLPRLGEVHIDGAVLLFTTGLSLLTGVVFGLAPALHSAGSRVSGGFNALGRTASAGTRTTRARDGLVAGQVALSLMLLVGAGLLLRSLDRLRQVDAGFAADHLLTAQISLPGARLNDSAAVRRFWLDLVARAYAMPGIVAASAASALPLTGANDTYFWIEGHPPASEADRDDAVIDAVDDHYFATLRIPVVQGRSFTPADRAGTPGAVVLSAQLARRLFPGQSAVGKRLVVDFGRPFPATVVGVVGDVLAFGLDSRPVETIYYSPQQSMTAATRINVVLRTQADPMTMAQPLRDVVRGLDRDVPVSDVRTMNDIAGDTVSERRFGSQVLMTFALVALALALIGLYGVLGYAVSQRTREMGIRLALGAPRREVFGLIVRRGLGIVMIGVVAGLAGAVATTRLLDRLLFHVGAMDVRVFASGAILLSAAGLVACLIPARRATRIDPQVALRAE